MAASSGIEWTDSTWNPVRGCSKVSAGCKFCCAETFSERFRGVPRHPFERGFDLRLVPEKLAEPVRWRKPRRIFVGSVSDVFHESIPDDYLETMAVVMAAANWHTYQVLTKRSERMAQLLSGRLSVLARMPHTWWGVSVEDRKNGLPRIEHLRATPAAVRFLSVEPLLEDLGQLNLDGIHWVIAGGESGPRSRAVDPNWVRSVRDQCLKAQVPFFFKQWGGAKNARGGRELDGRMWEQVPATLPHPPDRDRVRAARIAGRIVEEEWGPPQVPRRTYEAHLPVLAQFFRAV